MYGPAFFPKEQTKLIDKLIAMLLRKLFKCYLPFFVLFSSTLLAQDCPDEGLDLSIIQFNLNSCNANDNGSFEDYKEFKGLSANKSDCATMTVVGNGGALYRNAPSVNIHSCTPGVDGTAGMCVSSETSCNFQRDSDLAIRFDVEVVPGTDPAQLKTLTFYEMAPVNYDWINGDKGKNNYPTKYGIRITIEDREVFRSEDLPTGPDWSLQSIDLSFFSGLVVDQPTIFSFELLAYCPVDNGAQLSLWDIDHIRLYAGCLSGINGGMLTVEDGGFNVTTCTGDGIVDEVDPSLKFSKGDQRRWLITDADGMILELPTSPPFGFENAGEGVCLIWNISYTGNINGLTVGANANNITGCYDLSNPITVNREGVSNSTIFINDGSGEVTDITLCTNDGIDDLVMVGSRSEVSTTANKNWVITDQSGTILESDARPPFNFEGVNEGTCLIWQINYRDGLLGNQPGENIADLTGCFVISNSLTVIRNQPLAGVIEFATTRDDELEICAGDGLSDEIRFRLSGNVGDESLWIITSTRDRIISVSNDPEYDFEEGDLVTYRVRHLSAYEDLQGLTVDNNLDDVVGCFNLSNTLTVVRNRVDAGSITTANGLTETGICIEAGQSNLIDVDLDDNRDIRANSAWLITTAAGTILDLPSRPPFDFSNAEGGVQLIWHLSYADISGLEIGESANDLQGCFDLSDPIRVNIGKSVGGMITGGPYLFCVGDGDDNFIPTGDIALGGASGSNSQWLITDDRGEILGLPDRPSDVNFDDAPEGTCLVWHLSYEDGIEGLEIGNNASRDLQGCFGLSNSIEVTRTSVIGGDLEGGPFSFCVGDGIIDTIVRNELQLFRWKGANRIWFITDTDGNILSTPVRPSLVNFDDAPAGTCLVWHASYEGDIEGIDIGNNINEITGCFDLSNSVVINRGGAGDTVLEGGPYSFCVGNGEPDMISASEISNNSVSGPGAQWILTDANGEIVSLPNSPTEVDFDEVTEGTCLIYLVNYSGDIVGLAQGENVSRLDGCFSISNALTVNRSVADGGELQGGPFNFCVGDGIEDIISDDDINLFGTDGDSRSWLVTDESGVILAIPEQPSDVNFDESPVGVCLLWHLSYSGSITGLTIDANANDLNGCFDLSNPVRIVRAGTSDISLEGGPFTFCVGNGEADMITDEDLSVTTPSGPGAQWVITDADGNILGLPNRPSDVDFDEVAEGNCLIYYINYAGDISGLELNNNVNTDLEGCYSLSNGVTVNRSSASGGELTGGPFNFCIGDGLADFISDDELVLVGREGESRRWLITDPLGIILDIPVRPSLVNFEEGEPGLRLIWHLGFSGDLEGLEVGQSAFDLSGCFGLSNPITVFRIDPEGGTIAGGPFEFCVGDDEADNIDDQAISISGNVGSNTQWIVTDDSGEIIGIPDNISDVNFNDAPAGECLVWLITFEGDIANLEVGNNASDLSGCFDLSNSISVIRKTGIDCLPPCEVVGGQLLGGPFTFCVGDQMRDTIATGAIELDSAMGPNMQWVVTDSQGNILGLPFMISDVDFDDAGLGECLIWNLSFEDGLSGAQVGNNVSQLEGCFALSNSISVTRLSPNGGVLTPNALSFCVGDGIADTVAVGAITLQDTVGSNFQWVVTDIAGSILSLPANISDVNFDDAPAGQCLIWNLSFEDGLIGATIGSNANDLNGCFSLSNPITVTRNSPEGGMLSGGPFTFCVGDSIVDNIPMGAISIAGNAGDSSQWLVTDTLGVILGLPDLPSEVDFEDAPAGACLVWHLSYYGEISGLSVGESASELIGCTALSNSIRVDRKSGDDCLEPCEISASTIAGGPFTFCVGDSIADNIPAGAISLVTDSLSNTQWAITDEQGNILGLPSDPSDVNFDNAGIGTCLIWNVSFKDSTTIFVDGANFSNLGGCYALSNSISVTRNQPLGGTLVGGPFTFCVGDSIADNIPVDGITLTGNTGSSQWVVTDTLGNILGLPASPSDVDFDDAGVGVCLVWNLSFVDSLSGAVVGQNASNIVGCFELSNPITVNRNQPLGGMLTGGPFTFCVGDSIADNIPMGAISLAGNAGDSSQWLVTDTLGIILGLPDLPSEVDFEDAQAGACLVWHLSYTGTVEGLVVGSSASDLVGCLSLSNPITVTRNSGDDCIDPCEITAGTITGGPFTFCVGDSIADNIPAGSIVLMADSLSNTQWVVTDSQGIILGLPDDPSQVDFDDAGVGTCLVWNITFQDSTTVFAAGADANNLGGCYALSNSITVTRNQPLGGTLVGGPFTFCVGDSIADNIPVDGITLTGNTGSSQWVVTDTLGNILGLPASPSDVDFDGAGVGVCLVWNLSFVDSLSGAVVGQNASNIVGCFELSNPITVNRNQPLGGMLSGGPFTFCVGDSITDSIPMGAITLEGAQGTNSQWVVTDDLGNIIGLPNDPSDVNFEDAEEGICFIWHLSFEDGLIGAVIDSNANDLSGCFSLSNPIQVIRNSGEDCAPVCDEVLAGTLRGGPFSFCVGDGSPDNIPSGTISLVVMDTTLDSRWVITDEQGVILALPNSPSDVDFDVAGIGTCLVWSASYQDSTTVFAIGANANNLGGCYALSNSIAVERGQPLGGTLVGGPFTFCVGDSIADNIPVDSISLTGQQGTNSQWVVTDTSGLILGLPMLPSDVDFDDEGTGTCLIWHLSFESGLLGAEIGNSADSLSGCFSLSNPITVNRVQPNGGILTGGPFEFCVGDGLADFIPIDSISLSGNSAGSNSQWVVTDTMGIILSLPVNYEVVNFEDSPAGACLVWHLSFEGPLSGGVLGGSADSLIGCFDLSNPIRVNRLSGLDCPVEECNVNGGIIAGGPFEFCVGDGLADTIPMNAITLDSAVGQNFQWVVTDSNGVILGLPEDPSSVNFDIAPAGTCILQHLSTNGNVESLELGQNLITDVSGCFDLSNSIVVTRNTGDDCPTCDAVGGRLISIFFEFCVGDEEDDFIEAGQIVLTENAGANTQWVVTDSAGVIVGLPSDITTIDFGVIDPGLYFIRMISFDGELLNAVVGNNLSLLSGCFGISEPSRVDVFEPQGGSLVGGPFSFCVGDGIADMITGSIAINGATGEDNRWIITDLDQNIISLPEDISDVDFENAGVDTCLIWNLSSSGAVGGLLQDSLTLSDISGCFGLSNSVTVFRVSGDDCQAVVGIPVINEITDNDRVEIKNIGASPIDVGTYWLCNRPLYERINSLTIECGGDDYVIAPGEVLTVVLDIIGVAGQDGELGLYKSSLFADSDEIIDYVQWGSSGHGRESVAISAGIWSVLDSVPAFNLGRSISYDGDGNLSSDWTETDPNLCVENPLLTDPQEKLSIKIFPVPASNEINFELNHVIDEMHKVSIYDNYGHTLYANDMNADDDFRLNVGDFKSGIYYLKVKTGSYSGIQRFVIVN